MSAIFKGLSAFPITPSDANGTVDTDTLQTLVTRLAGASVNSIGLLGSTGTYAYLDRDERQSAVIAAAEVKGNTPLIVGIGALRTDMAVRLAEDAQAAGADGLLLAPVSYTPLTQEEAFVHFRTVAGATDLPLCVYNNPGTTHFSFGQDLLRRLAALPNISAVKMPLPAKGTIADDLAQLRAVLPSDFVIGYSGDWGVAEAMQAGADAFYSALGGTIPHMFLKLVATATSGDTAATAALNNRIAPLWEICRKSGSLRLAYALAARLGLSRSPLPLPLLPLDEPALAQLDLWLSENHDLAH